VAGQYGIQVTEVSIKDIRFDKDFEQAVERKQIAQQVAEQKRYEVDQAKREAESKVRRERGEGAALRRAPRGGRRPPPARGAESSTTRRSRSRSRPP
jgi:regulator of protease activity HflC (stomatin/prohibitin superfamily)